jgi:hypothetical protein
MLSQVTHHSAIFPPSMRNTAPKFKLRLSPRRWKWGHWLLRALIPGPCSDEIPLGDQTLDRLDRIGKNRRILPQKFLDLIKIPSLHTRRCLGNGEQHPVR